LHFLKVIQSHTDVSLGDCGYLNTCVRMASCKYVHYELERDPKSILAGSKSSLLPNVYPRQFINCDVRHLDMSILGKFSVVMADPPWFIHQKLPYGTLDDDEMRSLQIPVLQDDGYIFLWVTGRAMELGRECLTMWGYCLFYFFILILVLGTTGSMSSCGSRPTRSSGSCAPAGRGTGSTTPRSTASWGSRATRPT